MNCKTIGMKLTAAALTALFVMQNPVQTLRAAAANPQYLSEMIISYGSTDDEAKNWLRENGYQIIDQNLNQDAEGGSSAFGWLGLASTKRSVYLGYRTTANPDDAITDMKIMNMNGGYSYQAYEKVLEETKREKEHFLSNLMAALTEYRANYKAGKTKAVIAHDNLNKFYDDDSGQYMGDLLLNSLKTEDEAAWEADPKHHADMVTILMQGNSTVISEIMQNLAFAADTAKDSWLDRALATEYTEKPSAEGEDFEGDDEFNGDNEFGNGDDEFGNGSDDEDTETADHVISKNGFEALLYQYEKEYGYDEGTLAMRMVAEYDDYAKMFASSLVGLNNLLMNYTKSGLSAEATMDEADRYFEEHPFESWNLWTAAYQMYEALSNVTYHGESLLNYLVLTENDYLSNTAYLEGWEEEKIPQRALLYPFIASMSEGQKALLEYTALNRMLTIGLMDEDTWKSLDATLKDTEFGTDKLKPCSVYAEVNRDDFKVGSIAVTNVAQGLEATTGEAPDGMTSETYSMMMAGIGIGSLAIGAAGVVIAAKNWPASGTSAALKNAVNAGKSVVSKDVLQLTGGITKGNMKLYHSSSNIIKTNSIDEFISAIETNTGSAMKETMLRRFPSISNGYSYYTDVSKVAPTYLHEYRKILTVSGPNQESISFSTGMIWNNENRTLTLADGTIYGNDGIVGVDEQLRREYDDFINNVKRLNPDIQKAAQNTITKEAYDAAKIVNSGIDASMKRLGNQLGQESHMEDFMNLFDDLPTDAAEVLRNPTEALKKLSPEQYDMLIDRINDLDPDAVTEVGILEDIPLELKNAKARIMTQKNYELQQMAEKVADDADDIIQRQNALTEEADDVMSQGTGSTFWTVFGLGMAVFGFAMSAYSVYCAIDEMQKYYHTEMIPIPRKMVDRGIDQNGNGCYIYYDCTLCNRTAMNMGNETLGDYGDLNGDVMKQWMALYTTKDTRAGKPITADFTVKKGTAEVPLGKTPLTFFGFDSAVNMVDESYVYNDKVGGIYLYYKPDASAGYTGTVTSSGVLATTGVLSAIGGAGIYAGISALAKRRKKTEAAA